MDIYDKILFIIYNMFNCGCTIPRSCVRCKQGDRGLIGPQGPIGPRGQVGHTGFTGFTGSQGPMGSIGPTGPAGSGGGGGTGGIGFTGSSYGNYIYWNNSSWVVGSNNITLGSNAGKNGVGSGSIAIGTNALNNTSTVPTGTQNICIGTNAGKSLTTGSDNTIVGSSSGTSITSGNSNVVVGYNCGNGINNGIYNTLVGYGVSNTNNTSYSTALGYNSNNAGNSYSTAIGYQSVNTSSYQVMLGNPFTTVVSPGTFYANNGIVTSTTQQPSNNPELGYIFNSFNPGSFSTTITSTITSFFSFNIDPVNITYGTYLVILFLCVTNGATPGSYYTSLSPTGSPQQPTDVTYIPANATTTIKYTLPIQAYSPTTYNIWCYSDAGVSGTIDTTTNPTGSYLSLTRIA
jgi:hypothetical protein